MAKVAMCAGHGGSGSTPGKRSPAGEYEWNFNDAVVRAAIAKLKDNGVEVLRTDDASGKTDVGLTARTNKANAWGADAYVSVHHNALGTKWLNYEIGIETFTQNGSHPQAERLARCIHPKYVKAMGLKDRGMKKSNLAITRQTKMPAVLTEGGFMDSRIDIKAMRSNAKLKAQGEAIADGIMEFLNVKNNKEAPKTSKPKQTQTGSTQTKNNKNMSVVDYLKSQGISSSMDNRKKLASQHGIKNYTGTASQNTKLLNALRSFGSNKTVDGKWGKSTTLALQKALGTPQDGFISKQPRNSVTQSLYGNTVQFGNGGSNVVVALQRKVGAKADGKLGPATIRALQKALGTPQDGVLSRPSMVVKELQRRLNAGTF
ncbi:N-acetylmuramoyl-L-alanine amidase [Oceanobacillus sp. FSL K6-0251]|uniref:N-acetylmuramoyl-L-alanine amidase n=1 Tax=Oceanobacillus sp. FSL K6-0251 TaxID=2921602 RepID=UPI0030F5B979